MDISVSRLNGRLAQKLPPELPLGLVFVVGKVAELGSHDFVLTEETHQLTCRAHEAISSIGVGDEVRVSGHLMFDDRQLQYYLRAGDIERVTAEPLSHSDPQELLTRNNALLAALEGVKARAAVAPTEDQETLPVWVQKLAPVEAEQEGPIGQNRRKDRTKGELDTGLVALLSEAMDSEEEMELTPELLAPYLPSEPDFVEEGGEVDVVEEDVEEETAASLAALSTSYQPVNRQDTDWLVILLIVSFIVLAIAAVVATVLLLV